MDAVRSSSVLHFACPLRNHSVLDRSSEAGDDTSTQALQRSPPHHPPCLGDTLRTCQQVASVFEAYAAPLKLGPSAAHRPRTPCSKQWTAIAARSPHSTRCFTSCAGVRHALARARMHAIARGAVRSRQGGRRHLGRAWSAEDSVGSWVTKSSSSLGDAVAGPQLGPNAGRRKGRTCACDLNLVPMDRGTVLLSASCVFRVALRSLVTRFAASHVLMVGAPLGAR